MPDPSREQQIDSFAATQAQLTAAWDVRGIDIETVAFRRGTAVEGESGVRPAIAVQRVRTLPALLDAGPEGTLAQFELGDVLGEGGMGVVRAARQTALEREVAIKALRDGADPVRAAPQLLREARVTGALEHPNVVPVYALGRDNDDQPLIVMKRIGGTSWEAILEDADDEARRGDAYLREQLRILRQVASAVHFAHRKGVVHRDIKPENVMIGAFDEVYVVDWGIAVSLHQDSIRGVPLAQAVTGIEGTPSYMAPEMAAGDAAHIDERSDVYLLGATLHQILTGSPPHGGGDLPTILTHAFASAPKRYPEHVPAELAAIAHRAMARDGADRYPSAADFSRAIDEFLEHRSSTLLCQEADKRLEALCTALAAHGEGQTDDRSLHMLFSECRFGYQQALRAWEDNDAARAGLREALRLMIELELGRGAAAAAAALLRELPDPPDDLKKRVARALRKQHEAELRLRRLELDADLSFGARLRRSFTYAIGAAWALVNLASGLGPKAGWFTMNHVRFALVCAGFTAASIVAAMVTRATMMANAPNRRVSLITITVFAAQACLWWMLHTMGLSMPDTNIVTAFSSISLWITAALVVDASWAALALGNVIITVTIALFPAWHFELSGAISGIASMLIPTLKRRRAPDSRRFDSSPPSR